MQIAPWEKLSEEPQRLGWRKILRRLFRLPDGRELVYDVKDEGRTVCVLALTAERNVVLVRQFRQGPERVLAELPGGMAGPDEPAEGAAARELLEETGYVGELTFVGTHWTCAYANRQSHDFVAVNCRKVAEPEGDDTEFMETVEMPLDAFRAHLRSGELTDAAAGWAGLAYLNLL